MAAAAVDHLIAIIASTIQNEAALLGGVHDELDQLRIELEKMDAFLQDAEREQAMSVSDKTLVTNIRDLAYQAEDIIDEFMYHMHQPPRRGDLFIRFLRRLIRIPKNLWFKHQIASKLQKIKKAIVTICDTKLTHGINRTDTDHSLSLYQRDSSLFMKEEDIIGFANENRLLNGWLADGVQQRTLISVVGMGGCGKTTLVANIFNDATVKSNFDCHALISVSQTYKREDLFKNLIKEFHQSRKEPVPDLGTTDFKQLVETLLSYLEKRRYLVVLDDVWDTNLWEIIKVAFPDNKLRSRIMLTTRKQDVASSSSGVRSHILHMQPLERNEAWGLFCKKAFSNYPNQSCPKELEPLVWKLVDKCEGLPLAIVALGALMSSRKSAADWTNVINNLNWQLTNNQNLDAVKSILLLSYMDLPYPLKQCFLYCCLFPEDYEIQRKRLIRLWVAEGFVKQKGCERMMPEEVADGYLMELVLRSMLQVVRRNEFGRPRRCKMHDLLRELAVSMSEREQFCRAHDGRFAMEESKSRRLSIQTTIGDLHYEASMSQCRSLFVFANDSWTCPSRWLSKFKLLKVLDLQDATIDKLEDEVGTLFNLRYLNLRGTPLRELPKSIGKLGNLQTLDISNTQIKEVPKEVSWLQNLESLLMYHVDYSLLYDFNFTWGTKVPFNIKRLKKLKVMLDFEGEGDIIKQLGSLTQLRTLGITKLKDTNQMGLCSSILNLKQLRSLYLFMINEEEAFQLDALQSPPPHLLTLSLVGKLERVPCWFSSLDYLTYLQLHWSRLEEDLLLHIQALPNLGFLVLVNAFIGGELHFCTGFPKLVRLDLVNFPHLTIVSVDEGVMPNLEELYLNRCLALNSLPQGIEFLTNLRYLDVRSCSPNLTGCVKDIESYERSKMQHILNLKIYVQD